MRTSWLLSQPMKLPNRSVLPDSTRTALNLLEAICQIANPTEDPDSMEDPAEVIATAASTQMVRHRTVLWETTTMVEIKTPAIKIQVKTTAKTHVNRTKVVTTSSNKTTGRFVVLQHHWPYAKSVQQMTKCKQTLCPTRLKNLLASKCQLIRLWTRKWTAIQRSELHEHHQFSFLLLGLMAPLTRTSSAICNVILSLCIPTINSFPNIMASFMGDFSLQPRVNVTVNNKTRRWLYDTGASKTCINLKQFRELFPKGTPRQIKSLHSGRNLECASGNSLD